MKLLFFIDPPPKESLLKGIPAGAFQKGINDHLIFGRGHGVDIFLNDETASRLHMKVFVLHPVVMGHTASFVVETVSDTKPVLINGQSLGKSAQKQLQTGDRLNIGKLTFTVKIVPGDSQVCYEVQFVQGQENHVGSPYVAPTGIPNTGFSNQQYPVVPCAAVLGGPSLNYAGALPVYPGPTNIGQFAPVSGYPAQRPASPYGIQPPQQVIPYGIPPPGHQPLVMPPANAPQRREAFHGQKQPSENSEKEKATFPVQESCPPK